MSVDAVAELRDVAHCRYGVAVHAHGGSGVAGDVAVVRRTRHGLLAAVVDGLGHGPEAASAAVVAADVIAASSDGAATASVRRCHRALRNTRGAAVSVASLSIGQHTMVWTGVGSVEGRLLRARSFPATQVASLRLNSGVVGNDVSTITAQRVSLEPGDLLILASDGVHPSFANDVDPAGSPQELADGILARHGRTTDDALVLVLRYLPETP